ncbi:amidohydrolase 2 [Thozetella sp. PMI_491]|nr:amidohydrolase 2 [Thozetella sp. PMI_491]
MAEERAGRDAPLIRRLPPGSWDSHMHTIEPDRFPTVMTAFYTPQTHTLRQALEFEASVGISNIVIVQPSVYGNDNACLLDVLRELGPERCRGVVQFDPDVTSLDTLREWDALGVRGVRINLYSVGKTLAPPELEATLRRFADAVRPLDWVVQVYVPLFMVETLESIVPTLRVRFCIDHLGQPDLVPATAEASGGAPPDPYALPGFASLVRLLREGHAYVKLSAPYRISKRADLSDLEPLAREVIRVGGLTRVVFATDWPHTRFEGLDIRPFMEQVLDWCGDDDHLVERLFRGNAEVLWRGKD